MLIYSYTIFIYFFKILNNKNIKIISNKYILCISDGFIDNIKINFIYIYNYTIFGRYLYNNINHSVDMVIW